ncbi:MAG TPA: sensor domain-containing diguanylate cyclase [Spirochaetia bacterium]|nr:sensor domain-containing diguanylate cyclase [Spirochaetales bacterium]HRW24623.1 sensor domain-containing diguanylate cyclase [Spirochaetia bacterium]
MGERHMHGIRQRSEAAKVRRTFYSISLLIIVVVFIVFATSHFTSLKRQNDDNFTRLEEFLVSVTKTCLKDTVSRTLADIDLERRIIRRDQNVAEGDVVAEERADELAKARAIVKIRETRLKQDGYLWAIELLDPAGGKDYARLLAHGREPDTEGMLLSTDEASGLNASQYRLELDGILRDGEAFYTYYAPKAGEKLPSPMLVYAALYPDFSWIVATGVYTDDIESTILKERKVAEAALEDNAASSITTLVLALLAVLGLVIAVDQATARVIAASYERITATEKELRVEKTRVEEAYSMMKELAERDELTGLRNRRSGLNRLNLETARSTRSGTPFCVAIGDIDHFKPFNDLHGHETGDLVLRRVSGAIERSVRLEDMAARWGGEEFLILLSGDSLAAALEACDRIRKAVSAEAVAVGSAQLHISMTIGVAEFSKGESIDELVARADAAMYKGKAAGRDIVVAAPPPRSRS